MRGEVYLIEEGRILTHHAVVGNIVCVLTTSALLIALPLGLALEDEAKLVAQEKEMFEQQQGTQGVSSCTFSRVVAY